MILNVQSFPEHKHYIMLFIFLYALKKILFFDGFLFIEDFLLFHFKELQVITSIL